MLIHPGHLSSTPPPPPFRFFLTGYTLSIDCVLVIYLLCMSSSVFNAMFVNFPLLSGHSVFFRFHLLQPVQIQLLTANYSSVRGSGDMRRKRRETGTDRKKIGVWQKEYYGGKYTTKNELNRLIKYDTFMSQNDTR